MRGTRAKELRRLAEQLSVDLSKLVYEDRALNRAPSHKFRRTRFLTDCTRLVYQNLKKKYKGTLHE